MKKIRHKDFINAKDQILEKFKTFTSGNVTIPKQFANNPEYYKEFTVKSAIVGEISKLESMVFEGRV